MKIHNVKNNTLLILKDETSFQNRSNSFTVHNFVTVAGCAAAERNYL